MSLDTSPDGISREESRHLDGELPPEAARRLERQLAADPERTARMAAWRESMDLWRSDASRPTDTGALAEHVLAAVAQAPPPPAVRTTWYAAAAAILIAIGVTGTLLAHDGIPTAAPRAAPLAFDDVESAVVDLMFESPKFALPAADPK